MIITLCHADLSDIITPQLLALTDFSEIDYVLCLQTTKQGKLIDQLLPMNQEPFFSLKIALLKGVLSKRALWIEGPDEDVVDLTHIIHALSLRDSLHTVAVTDSVKDDAVETQLFGAANPLSQSIDSEKPLLLKLNNFGTLFIKNVDLLSSKTQQRLAEFVQFGQISSERHAKLSVSDVRIICTGSRQFKELLAMDTLHPTLATLFASTLISIPDINSLSKDVIEELIQNLSGQMVQKVEVARLFTVSRAELETEQFPKTLRSLRITIQECLEKKAKEFVDDTTIISYTIFPHSDQLVFEAAKCGRQSLKDKLLMRALWDRFKNQSKIAELLQVDRSSVFRCLKKYGYIT